MVRRRLRGNRSLAHLQVDINQAHDDPFYCKALAVFDAIFLSGNHRPSCGAIAQFSMDHDIDAQILWEFMHWVLRVREFCKELMAQPLP